MPSGICSEYTDYYPPQMRRSKLREFAEVKKRSIPRGLHPRMNRWYRYSTGRVGGYNKAQMG